jgi:hypothetical protein
VAVCRECPRVTARARADVPVWYPRSVVYSQNRRLERRLRRRRSGCLAGRRRGRHARIRDVGHSWGVSEAVPPVRSTPHAFPGVGSCRRHGSGPCQAERDAELLVLPDASGLQVNGRLFAACLDGP